MKKASSQRLTRFAHWLVPGAAVALDLFRPIFNPDIYWHLCAAQRIANARQIPSTDWLSSSMMGAPWRDFEWLTELLFYAFFRAGGLAGLWILKGLIVALLIAAFINVLRAMEIDPGLQAPTTALFACAILPFADLRPDMISAIALLWLYGRLETAGRRQGSVAPFVGVVLFFALWANMHAGYPLGLVLLAMYACLGERAVRRSAALSLVAGLIGCCLQPGGPLAFSVLWQHAHQLHGLANLVIEWAPPLPQNHWYWTFFTVELIVALTGAIALIRRRPLPAAPAVIATILGLLAMRHARLTLFFPIVALPLSVAALSGAKESGLGRWSRFVLLTVGLLATAHSAVLALAFGTGREIVHPVISDRTTGFFANQKRVLGGHSILAHSFEWSGYLEWRLWPAYRLFADGRYIFYPALAQVQRATGAPKAWGALLKLNNIDLVILERDEPFVRLPQKGERSLHKSVAVPYHTLLMPSAEWALVHTDEDVLVFARRSSFPAAWVATQELAESRF